MKKLLKSKTGRSDPFYVLTYMLIFVLMGVFLPYIAADFNETISTGNIEGITQDLEEDAEFSVLGSGITMIASIGKMFFWTFGDLPFWVDAIFLVIRAHFWFLVGRFFRGS